MRLRPKVKELLPKIAEANHRRHIDAVRGYLQGHANRGVLQHDKEKKRQAVNEWIRSSGAFDGVIDFDAATRDRDHPGKI